MKRRLFLKLLSVGFVALATNPLKLIPRVKDAYEVAKAEALKLHSMELEKAFLFGTAQDDSQRFRGMSILNNRENP